MSIYYVYAYVRSSDGTPYYIGKGKGRRAFEKTHNVSVPKDCSKIIFLESNLTEVGALALERRYIKWYGRKDNGTGILHNKTDGGDGVAGRKYHMCDDTKQKISVARTGIVFTEQHRSNLSKNHKGRLGMLTSDSTKMKQSVAAQNATKSICPHCGKIGKHSNMVRWHFDNCKFIPTH